MGFFDYSFDGGSIISRKSHSKHSSHKHKHRSRSRSSSRKRHSGSGSFAAGIFGGDTHHHKHNSSRGSFFGLGNASRSSFFGTSKASYYKRSPRDGYMLRAYKQVKRLLRDLVHYAKRHPMKVLTLVLMPLITGGALTALLAKFGLRLPAGLERMMGVGMKAATGDGLGLVSEAMRMAGELGGGGSVHIERGRDGEKQWERKTVEKDSGWSEGILGVAKMFI